MKYIRFVGISSIIIFSYSFFYIIFDLINIFLLNNVLSKSSISLSQNLIFYVYVNLLSFMILISLFINWSRNLNKYRSKYSNTTLTSDNDYNNISNISIIIPAYNEELNIEKVLMNENKNIWKRILIDDASTDNTVKIANKYDVEIIQHDQNLGVGAAIKSGYIHGGNIGSNLLIVMAGDNQHSMNDLNSMLTHFSTQNLDYLIGSRLIDSSLGLNMPKFRIFGNFLLSFLTSIASNNLNLDSQCGYTIISKNALEKINFQMISNRWGVPNDVFFECVRNDIKIGYHPIETIYGNRKSYINLYDFISRLMRILVKGSYNTSFNKNNPSPSYDVVLFLIIISLIMFYFSKLVSMTLFLLSFLLSIYNQKLPTFLKIK